MNCAVFTKDWRTKPEKPKPAAAFPLNAFRNAALLTINHFLQAWHAVSNRMVAHFDANIFPPHFMRHCGSGA